VATIVGSHHWCWAVYGLHCFFAGHIIFRYQLKISVSREAVSLVLTIRRLFPVIDTSMIEQITGIMLDYELIE